MYELELNGKKVGDQVFTPGWTNYRKRLQYQVYDVTDQLVDGENAIGSILGDGWYRGHFGWWENNRNNYGEVLGLLLQLEIRYEDGDEVTIVTDDSWKASTGPILMSDIYNGETYDARLEMPDWSSPGFDDSDWGYVTLLEHSKTLLTASNGEKVKKISEIKPSDYFETPKGEKVFDLIPDDKKAIVAKRLADNVDYFGHLTTGFLGTPLINYALSDSGYPDQAYRLLFNKRYPSWLYPVTMGATTIWERWNNIKPDGQFPEGINSFNHYAYGAIGEWLYSFVAGIAIDEQKPGYQHILIQPHPGGGFTNANAHIHTMFVGNS